MFQEIVQPICYRTVTQCVAEERVYICVPVESLLTPSGAITGHFGFFTAQLEVLAVCLKQQQWQQTHGFTVLAAFTQATLSECRQKPELTPVNVPH